MTKTEKAIQWCEDLITQTGDCLPDCTPALANALIEQKECAKIAIGALKVTRWIPASERLPEEGIPCVVRKVIGQRKEVVYDACYFNKMSKSFGTWVAHCIIHWLPQPKVPWEAFFAVKTIAS